MFTIAMSYVTGDHVRDVLVRNSTSQLGVLPA
jgi:hypothetical protein